VVTASAADAAVHAVGADQLSPAGQHRMARQNLPAREISSKMDKKGTHKIVFTGKVKGDPTYASKRLKIERKVGKHGTWRTYAKPRTNDNGWWRQRVGAPKRGKWFFRATTAATKHYRESHSTVWYTYSF
jgi:hypothetical protein